MNISVRRTFLGLGVLLCMILSSSVSYRYFFVHRWSPARRAEDANWIATSGSWVDRQLCTWFGACGILHLNHANWVTHAVLSGDLLAGNGSSWDTHTFWLDGKEDPEHWSDDERALRNIPDYVLEHAPLVHLYSGEQYWPCDVAEHMHHTKPYFNDMPIGDKATRYNLSNLDTLEEWGRNAFLHSGDNVEAQPSWLTGKSNIPKEPKETVRHSNKKRQPSIARRSLEFDSPGEPLAVTDTSRVFDDLLAGPRDDKIDDIEHEQPANPRLSLDDILPMQRDSVHAQRPLNVDVGQTRLPGQPESQRQGGRSEAPVVMITVNKGNGIVDAFYFYFYSFNLGNKVLNIRFGNHVADWEHSAVRFQHGIPKAMYFSQHASGVAYTWDAVEKIGKRPVAYSASGSHAMYPTPGLHPYILPWGLLFDSTDRGPLWDPTLNLRSYTYDAEGDVLRSSTLNPKAPVEWFYYTGHWGDKVYPLNDARQYRIAGEYHYVSGPMGPRFKGLGRKEICAGRAACRPKTLL